MDLSTIAESFWGYWGYTEKDNNKNTCLIWKWEDEDLVLDNKNLARRKFADSDTYYPYVAFNAKLALKMGWFTQNQAGGYEIGPNLIMSYVDGTVPAKKEADFVSPSNNPLYYRCTLDKGYTPNVTWIWLSMRVNWKFVNLNQAFQSVIQDPTRTLHVYSDVGSSTMVGNKIVDLLREVKYQRTSQGQVYFEPHHIQYIPVRREVMDIIEVQVAETVGTGDDLAKFGPGHTLVTLHFKQ